MKKAFLFPGQGSQFVGMGKDLYDNFKTARLVFEEVDDALGMHLSKIIFSGPEYDLGMTENTQPALMATSLAHYLTHIETTGEEADFFAGHSLGEYSALTATGVFSISDAVKLLKIRGKAMQEACKDQNCGMAALLGFEIEIVQELIDKLVDKRYICEIANHNSREQVVVSGHIEAIDIMVDYFKNIGKKAVKLKVSAPFHSSLIKSACNVMHEALSNVKLQPSQKLVISNVNLEFFTTENIIPLLTQQVASMVRWHEIMELLIANGVSEISEFGPGDILKNLFKRRMLSA